MVERIFKTEDKNEDAALDFVAMARQYKRDHQCSFREASYAIKKQYPESRDAFKGEPLPL